MDQPKTQRGRRSRAAIVRAAARLMYERGVRATSIDDVLLAAHAGKSQLYHYFDTKEDVAAAVLEHQLAQVLNQQAAFRLETWTGLRAWFDALLEGQRAGAYRGCPVGSMAAEMSAMSDDMRDRVGAAFSGWQRTLEDAFIEMKSRGRFRPEARPETLAAVTLAQIQGGYLLSTASQTVQPMKQALDGAYANLRSYAA
ncbi:MAG: TetR family transcriptional regulator C-terminal domain-containing protein [Actinomycetota bacterium]|nr:TetR family transcriptional regulator C-terminal domain-containing protein [Actinomycetota bacterium]